jgi:BolA protein
MPRYNPMLWKSSMKVTSTSDTRARDGRGHFQVTIVSDRFKGLPPIQRHRLVYDAVGDLMETDIHALSIKALTSSQAG